MSLGDLNPLLNQSFEKASFAKLKAELENLDKRNLSSLSSEKIRQIVEDSVKTTLTEYPLELPALDLLNVMDFQHMLVEDKRPTLFQRIRNLFRPHRS